MEYKDDFKTLLDLFLRLVESNAGNVIPSGETWQNDAQILSLKFFCHLVSMKLITEGTEILRGDIVYPFIDYSSAKVLSRACLETFLVFAHIYLVSSRSTAIFRHRSWNLGGLLDRQKFQPLTKEAYEKLQEEKQKIEILRFQIVEDPEFALYEKKQQKRLLEGHWRADTSWNQLAVAAGFNKSYISQIYHFFCSYSHSSYLSILQLGQAKTIEDQEMLVATSIDVANSVLGHFILSYCKVFPDANSVLAMDIEGKACAESWHGRSRSF